MTKIVSKDLAKELQTLVYWSVDLLGKAIQEQYGKKCFTQIEKIRLEMKGLRKANTEQVFKQLQKTKLKIVGLQNNELHQLAHSYALMLELINRCETAYRTHKLNRRAIDIPKQKPYAIIFVLTAHPTEARSPELLVLFEAIQKILTKALEQSFDTHSEALSHLLRIALMTPMARSHKPSLQDEALNINNFILRSDILDSLVYLAKQEINVSFRSWVGGDKDGHPGVDEKATLQCFSVSRQKIVQYLEQKIISSQKIYSLGNSEKCDVDFLFVECLKNLKSLSSIQAKDGLKVDKFHKNFKKLIGAYSSTIGQLAPELFDVEKIIWIFPALLVPLEFREDSSLVADTLSGGKKLAIERMLTKLKEISEGINAKWYVRGFVLSMAESTQDIENGVKLVKKVFKSYKIPVVPLFETELALVNSSKILQEFFDRNKSDVKRHLDRWGQRYEVMVGYSDSSKESGVFPSRYLISKSLLKIEKCLSKNKLTPVFFHGSGGSIERGGGSIKEQTGWWPKSALNIFKATTQGEMVARSFANSEIFTSRIYKIVEQLNLSKKRAVVGAEQDIAKQFAKLVQKNYQETLADSDFIQLIQKATPYNYLHHLKIGSRPSKRSQKTEELNLRAIPWILCWTQTRVLFPTWWGVGSAWESLTKTQKQAMRRLYKTDFVLRSYIKALGFTLTKIELGVFKYYLQESDLDAEIARKFFNLFKEELERSHTFFRELSGEKEMLWFRPWLKQSIEYRSSMIHPLNIIQIESLKRNDLQLLRKTVTGVACGMLTTG